MKALVFTFLLATAAVERPVVDCALAAAEADAQLDRWVREPDAGTVYWREVFLEDVDETAARIPLWCPRERIRYEEDVIDMLVAAPPDPGDLGPRPWDRGPVRP
jgi:hypothetical protein